MQEETPTQAFPVNTAKFLKTSILKNIYERLPLKLVNFFFPFAIFNSVRNESIIEHNTLLNIQRVRNPAGIYLLTVNNRSTTTSCEICSKLTTKTPERRHWRRFGVFIVNFEYISQLVLVFLLLTLNRQIPARK